MLIAEGTVRIETENRQAALDALRDMIPKTHAEPGCIAYRFAWDIDDETLLHIHEEWVDEEALSAHLASAHIEAFDRTMSDVLSAPPDLRVHEVTGTRPMFGD